MVLIASRLTSRRRLAETFLHRALWRFLHGREKEIQAVDPGWGLDRG